MEMLFTSNSTLHDFIFNIPFLKIPVENCISVQFTWNPG